jgi:DNA/RNA-binding protein KIN17
MMSESHQRQLLLVGENPGRYLDYFSDEFLRNFMDLLRRQFGTRRVHCNVVYNEYIKDRHHFHMNSTKWVTLTGLVKWLGREGLCKVDETEKGWFIQYIERDPETLARLDAATKKDKMMRDDVEREKRIVEKMVERGASRKEEEEVVYTELQRDEEGEKVAFKLGGKAEKKVDEKGESVKPASKATPVNPLEDGDVKSEKRVKKEGRKRTALDDIMEMEKKKAKAGRRDDWLFQGITVKVVYKKLGERYYKKKGVVQQIEDRFTAVLKMIDTGDILKVDQTHLETVIPAVGKTVLIVNGAYRGTKAVLKSLDIDNYCVSVKLDTGLCHGAVVDGISYEDVCKLTE